MQRIVASMLAIAIAICFSVNVGCSPSDKKPAATTTTTTGTVTDKKDFTLSADKAEIKLDKTKDVTYELKATKSEFASVTEKPADDTKITGKLADDKKSYTITVAKDAKVGDYTFKFKGKDDKTADFKLTVKAE